jgi:hypothetical protein
VNGAGGGGKGPARVSNHLRKDKAGKFIGYTYKKPKPKSRPTLGLTFPGGADGAAGGGGGGASREQWRRCLCRDDGRTGLYILQTAWFSSPPCPPSFYPILIPPWKYTKFIYFT